VTQDLNQVSPEGEIMKKAGGARRNHTLELSEFQDLFGLEETDTYRMFKYPTLIKVGLLVYELPAKKNHRIECQKFSLADRRQMVAS
jgi:hypothetical protein